MSIEAIIALIGLTITILGAVIAVTRYVVRLQGELQQKGLEAENQRLDQELKMLRIQYDQVLDEYNRSRSLGQEVLTLKRDIDGELETIMRNLQARSGSVLIQIPSEQTATPPGMVFLSIKPTNEQTQKLQKVIVPIESSAGKCFTQGRPFIYTKTDLAVGHYEQADQFSGYQTQQILNFPLHYGKNREIVGVLQLLNRVAPLQFEENDFAVVETYARTLAKQVAEFIVYPKGVELLGITPDRADEYATIMFCDMTHSSVLFRELNSSSAIQYINQYLETICEVAFRHGATVDKYIGDGVMLRFNIPRRVRNHPLEAILAALEIRSAFRDMIKGWKILGNLPEDIHVRIGLSYGPVQEAKIGHPVYQYVTVLGRAVHLSSFLCSAATRDRDVILIDNALYKVITEMDVQLEASRFPFSQLGKAQQLTSAAYEVHDCVVNAETGLLFSGNY
ncbi:MAG: GAF domain-containing protein [Anaerolineae bacterium]|nr:GAF domain-containing protein [Anaerolineae bacterium]